MIQSCVGIVGQSFKMTTFRGCSEHKYDEKLTRAWRQLDWEGGWAPCPRKKNNRLRTLPAYPVTVYLDPECEHCTRLDEQLGGADEHRLGFYKRYADKNDPHIKDRPFPHVFSGNKAAVEELEPNAVVNMFATLADLDIDVTMQVDTAGIPLKSKNAKAGNTKCHT